jgi:glycosyltransferase involved in cell wall biosynthesis
MPSLVSIVIPTFNRARDLERALKSVILQTYSDWEVLIVDNHSCDDTEDIVKGLNESRMRLFKIHNNGVIAASRNMGIQHSRGEYVAFLDSDDWWAPRKLEISLKYLEQGADVVYHDLYIVKKSTRHHSWKKDRARNLRSPVFLDLIKNGNALKNSSVVVRKQLLLQIGGVDEDAGLITAEDFDAWLRIARITEKFEKIPGTLGYYWVGGGNTSGPNRCIQSLEALEDRYFEELYRASSCADFWWLNYHRGRAYFLMGCRGKAKSALAKIDWRQVPILVAAKALWMRFIIGLSRTSSIPPAG